MKLNSKESIVVGNKLLDAYGGSWHAVRAAGKRSSNGKLNVPAKPPKFDKSPKKQTG